MATVLADSRLPPCMASCPATRARPRAEARPLALGI